MHRHTAMHMMVGAAAMLALGAVRFASADLLVIDMPLYAEREPVLAVPDQPETSVLTATVVAVQENAFVAAYHQQEDGTRVLAGTSALLTPGRRERVPIPLDVPLVSGDRVYAALFADTNITGMFDEGDALLLDSANMPMFSVFFIDNAAEPIAPLYDGITEAVDFEGVEEVVEEPVVDVPVVETPVEETPIVEEPAVEVQQPIVEEPLVVEEPPAEDPIVEEPAVEPSVVEEPAPEPTPVPVDELIAEEPIVE